MTHPGSTTSSGTPPVPPSRRRRHSDINLPEPGNLVRLTAYPDEQPGVVVSSDEWWDALQLRGVSADAQVLVEWMRSGQPVRRWEAAEALEIVPPSTPTVETKAVRA